MRKLNIGFNNPKLAFLQKDIRQGGIFYGWDFSFTYGVFRNSIQIAASLLQSPLFDISRPNYLNFGGMGSSIGHEITHSFDELGKLINKFGNIENWWDRETVTNYDLRKKCMINQYSSFYSNATRLNIKGEQTLSENIADNGGLKLTQRAYKEWVQFHGEEDGLPGLNYAPSQLFWIAAAQIWCAVHRLDSLRYHITKGFHSPPEFRLKGSFANNEEFAKDFMCELGTKMNPVDKCSIW
ncbi:unnamed protein product [Orchesella dallaii]|uniref:Peptidase M13 C-terminal domain-containing protein n=1 Tax=Orchesella dallaii TaxID=48710 RepID=A0ABP1S0J8_9HEXA